MEFRHYPSRRAQHLFSVPFIYSMIVPFFFLDIFLEIYHRICFPLYGIPLIHRSRYIQIDRHKLSYLRGFEKVNCMYCGYANGLLRYASAIGAETERYWCGIRHAQTDMFIEPKYQRDFLSYGDEQAFREFVQVNAEGEQESHFKKQ